MKTILKKPLWFLFVLPFLLGSCTKEPLVPVTEIPINGDQKVIKIENNGIGIEFCLLNEQGQPATVFQQGENFKFHLAINNNIVTDTAMYIVDNFLGNSDLFNVYSEEDSVIGKPWILVKCLYISDAVNKLYKGEKWVMEIPWNEIKTSDSFYDSTAIIFLQCDFSGLNQPFLRPGKYFTRITQQFCLGRYLPHPQNETICTDTLTLKINFEIK